MNGQPPALPTPPPPPPAPVPPRQVVLVPQQGMGCFAKGCLTLLIVGFILLAGVIGGTWYVCWKAAGALTSPTSVDLGLVPPDEAQVRNAEAAVMRVKTATREETVTFTPADLNALVDRDPDFSEVRGHVRIDIANSIMTIRMSAPLDDIPWGRLKRRWFNASTAFSFTYEAGRFQADVRSAEANGHELPEEFLSHFVSSFNRSFNESFHEKLRENHSTEFWNHVKSMSLQDDKLVVKTQPE